MNEQTRPQNETVCLPEKKTWGFPGPTVVIDSQSTSPLRGIEAEQRFYRMYLMAKEGDLVLTDYPIDRGYWQYLDSLKLSLPKIVSVPNFRSDTLSLNAMVDHGPGISVTDYLKYYIGKRGARIQFFNLSPDEITLAQKLGNPTYIADLSAAENIGTKTGFRSFGEEYGVPMPAGFIANSATEVWEFAQSLGKDVIVKASAGTGGEELGSNVSLRRESWQSLGTTELAGFLESHLSPSHPPYVVEEKLKLPEASLHLFLDQTGKVVYPPEILGQIAHRGSYVGGYFPFDQSNGPMKVAIDVAQDRIVPGLKRTGATGFHCFDFLYAPGGEVYFIEDNTRPGALDFIKHFVVRVLEAQNLGEHGHSWYHLNVPLESLGRQRMSFQEASTCLSDILDPGSVESRRLGAFGLLSNPDVLPYGYALHLTAVSYGNGHSMARAKELHEQMVQKLI